MNTGSVPEHLGMYQILAMLGEARNEMQTLSAVQGASASGLADDAVNLSTQAQGKAQDYAQDTSNFTVGVAVASGIAAGLGNLYSSYKIAKGSFDPSAAGKPAFEVAGTLANMGAGIYKGVETKQMADDKSAIMYKEGASKQFSDTTDGLIDSAKNTAQKVNGILRGAVSMISNEKSAEGC